MSTKNTTPLGTTPLPTLSTPLLAALALFTAGITLDIITTTTLIAMPGFVELNPLVNTTLAIAGTPGFIAFKLTLTAIAYLVATHVITNNALTVSLTMTGITSLAAGLHNATLLL